MAFYNPYQMQQYQQQYQQPYQQQAGGYQMRGEPRFNRPGEIIRVNGIQGAQAYQMGANDAAALFDANEDYFYIKTTDGAGFATLRRFKFTPCQEDEGAGAPEYITRAEFEELKEVVLNGKQHIRNKQTADAAAK